MFRPTSHFLDDNNITDQHEDDCNNNSYDEGDNDVSQMITFFQNDNDLDPENTDHHRTPNAIMLSTPPPNNTLPSANYTGRNNNEEDGDNLSDAAEYDHDQHIASTSHMNVDNDDYILSLSNDARDFEMANNSSLMLQYQMDHQDIFDDIVTNDTDLFFLDGSDSMARIDTETSNNRISVNTSPPPIKFIDHIISDGSIFTPTPFISRYNDEKTCELCPKIKESYENEIVMIKRNTKTIVDAFKEHMKPRMFPSFRSDVIPHIISVTHYDPTLSRFNGLFDRWTAECPTSDAYKNLVRALVNGQSVQISAKITIRLFDNVRYDPAVIRDTPSTFAFILINACLIADGGLSMVAGLSGLRHISRSINICQYMRHIQVLKTATFRLPVSEDHPLYSNSCNYAKLISFLFDVNLSM